MNKNEAMKLIYNIVRELFPDSVRVDISVDFDGLKMSSYYKLIGKYADSTDVTIDNGYCERTPE